MSFGEFSGTLLLGLLVGVSLGIAIAGESFDNTTQQVALKACQQQHFTDGRYVSSTGRIECRNEAPWVELK